MEHEAIELIEARPEPRGMTHSPSEKDLRRELADAIANHEAAARAVAAAGRTLGQAQELHCEAGERAARLKAALTAANTAATNARAEAVLKALKAGSLRPNAAAPWPAPSDSRELTEALAEYHAL